MRAVQDKSHVSRHGARTVQRTRQNPRMPRNLSSSCDQNNRSLAVAPTSALAITCRRLLSLAPATDGIRQVSGVRGEVRAGRHGRVRTTAGLSGATEAAKVRACARATEDFWPLAGAGSGRMARAHLLRPREHQIVPPPTKDLDPALLLVDLDRKTFGARWGPSLYEHIWAQRCARIRMILPAGRTGSWRCSELLADLLSGQPGHCGRRGPYFTTRWRCRALEWGASPGRAMVLLD